MRQNDPTMFRALQPVMQAGFLARMAAACSGLLLFRWLAGQALPRVARARAFGLASLLGLVVCGLGAGLAAPAWADDGVLLRQWVTDPQNVLSADENAALSHKLYQLSQTVPGNPQILVSLPGHVDDISLYANEAFHKTGIGKKGVDNGLLVVLDIPDRQSRIEVGYGLEGVLTDLQTNDILQAAKPDLQAGHYAQAINGIVDALATELTHADPADIGGNAASKQPDSQTDAMEALIGLVVVGLLFVLLPIWLIRRSRRRAALYPGGYVPPEVQAERSAKWSFFLNLGLNILSAILQSRGGGRGGGSSGGGGGGFSGGGGDSGGGGSQSSW